MLYTIINGEGTSEHHAQTERDAYRLAQDLANDHGESYFVSKKGDELDGDENLGDEVAPTQESTR